MAGLLAALRERRPRILDLGQDRSKAIPRVMRALGASAVRRNSADVSRGVADTDVLLLRPVSAQAEGRRRMDKALLEARHRGVPVVLDLTGVLRNRRSLPALRRMIAAASWPVLSATAEELVALAQRGGNPADPVRLVAELLQSGGLAAIRGSTGLVTDGKRSVGIDTWHHWLETANQAGPLASVSLAAFLGVAHLADFITAAAAAMAYLGEATIRAARSATAQPTESRVIKELAR